MSFRLRCLFGAALAITGCGNARPVVDGHDRCFDSDGGVSYIHPCGWADPSSADFHGAALKESGFDFDGCKKCHGDDFKGGKSGASCYSCHADGPTGCTTCHGQPPKTGAHEKHVVDRKLDCTTCHVKPLVYTDAGHLDGKVEVTLQPGSFSDGRCSGVYCHGDTFTDSNAKNTKPLWTGGKAEAACGNCHGLAPSNHSRSTCVDCHPQVIDKNGALSAKHIDGKISLGDESGTCSACHTIDPQKLNGAHLAHLTAPLGLRGKLDCKDCHVVPATANDPAHPASPLVKVDYDGTRCSNSTCHLAATPAWSDGPSAAYCGTCHAVPPVDTSHAANLRLSDCATCHPTTMDATGAFVSGGTHMNGVVDAQ